MEKKIYVTPALELIKINGQNLMAGSPGAGINSDYSTPTTETPSDEQPTGW